MKKLFLILILSLTLGLASQAQAAIVQFAGFEAGETNCSEFNASCSSTSATTTPVHTGSYAYASYSKYGATNYGTLTKIGNPGDPAGGMGSTTEFFNENDLYVSYWVYPKEFPTTTKEVMMRFTTGLFGTKSYIYVSSGGNLAVSNTSSAILGTSTDALNLNAWNNVCVHIGTGAAGSYDLWINGTQELTGTGNFGTGSNSTVIFGKRINTSGGTVWMVFDDIFVDNASCQPSTAIVKGLSANSNGTYTGWNIGTGASDYTQVEIPYNGTFVKSNTTNDKFTVGVQSTASQGISGTMLGVKAITIDKTDQIVNGQCFQTMFISGATTATTTCMAFTGTATYGIEQFYTTDPNTSASWTTSAIDAVQVGVVNATSSPSNFYSYVDALEVGYIPAAATGFTPYPNPFFNSGLYVIKSRFIMP